MATGNGSGSSTDRLTIAGRSFASRLFVGTGKYRSNAEMQRCHQASGAEVVTVAVRRVNARVTVENLQRAGRGWEFLPQTRLA